MAKQGGTQPFPNPPKPNFPVPSPPQGFGGGGSNLGGGQGYSNFAGPFLRLMTEAGERLGKAAAEEIAKVQLTINGGSGGGFGNQPDGRPRARPVPGDGFAMLQFARAAGLPGAGILGMAGPVALGVLAAKLINFPAAVESQLNDQRHLGRVSPSIASAFAQSDARDLMRDLRIGEATAPSTKELLDARGRFKDQVSGPAGVAWDNWWNRAYTNFLNDMTKIFAPTIKGALGSPLDVPQINPWIERMDRLAGKQDERTEAAKRAAMAKHENDFRSEITGAPMPAAEVHGGNAFLDGMLNRGFP